MRRVHTNGCRPCGWVPACWLWARSQHTSRVLSLVQSTLKLVPRSSSSGLGQCGQLAVAHQTHLLLERQKHNSSLFDLVIFFNHADRNGSTRNRQPMLRFFHGFRRLQGMSSNLYSGVHTWSPSTEPFLE